MAEEIYVEQSHEQNDWHGQHYREVCAYLALGKDLYNEMNRNKFTCDENYGEILCTRSCAFIEGLIAISRNPTWPEAIVHDFHLLINEFEQMQYTYGERFNGFDRDDFQYLCPIIINELENEKGRSKFFIPRAQLVGLRSLNFTWKAIAEMLGVSEKTILRRRHEFGLSIGEDTYSSVTDEELDEKISTILSSSPNSGERLVIGALNAGNVKVKRARVRASIFRVDPVSRVLRRHTSIRRRVYSVPTPNALY